MDRIVISGTEPSSQMVVSKNGKWCPKVPKQAEAKKDGVINPPKIAISINFNTVKS